jgi:quercetin dioxygenase-like cupin family protein
MVAAAIATMSTVALAQDAVKVDAAHYKVVLENAAVRILRISYGPNEKSVMHSHPDAIAIPLTATKMRFMLPDGKSEDRDMAAETALYTPAGTHNPMNVGTTRGEVVLVEFKTSVPGKATLPASRPGLTLNVLAEGPRAMAYRTTATATFAEPAGTTHEFDQVVIALGPTQMALSIDGKPTKTTWARGEAVFIPRGTPHESKNTGGKPVDFVIVAIK